MFHLGLRILPQLISLILLLHSFQTKDFSEREDIYNKLRKPYSSKGQVNRIHLGRDGSGCICNEYERILTICFGRESCTTLPIDLNITTKEVSIVQTQISHIGPGDLDSMHQVQKLRIEGNFNLSSISPRVFEKFTSLENLSISFNILLNSLHEDTFVGLVNLKRLSLIKNGFTDINYVTRALSTLTVPKLIELSVNENKFLNINEDSFAPLNNSKLKELDLTFCQVEYLHPDSLIYLRNLEVLRVGENSFNVSTLADFMNRTVASGLPLRLLHLNNAGFRKSLPKQVLEVVALSNITDLNLANNQFDQIPAEAFPLMPNLRTLDISGVMVGELHSAAFANLPNLRTLLLGENKLTCLPEGVILPSLEILDLQHNPRDAGIFPFDISNGVFSNMKQLRTLNLNFDPLYHLSNASFEGLENLDTLYMKNASIFYIRPGSFESLKVLHLLDLENNLFVRNNYPSGMDPDTFSGLENLEVLLLGGNGITYLSSEGNPLLPLKSLKYLGLERNNIFAIPPTQFEPLIRLNSVSLSYNSIRFWDEPIFNSNVKLESLLLDHNEISRITPAMMQDFWNLKELTLFYNSIICDCLYFLNSNKLERNQLDNLVSILSKAEESCINPYQNQQVYSIAEYLNAVHNGTIFCETETNFVKMLPFGFSFLALILLILFAYHYRRFLKNCLFSTKKYVTEKSEMTPNISRAITN